MLEEIGTERLLLRPLHEKDTQELTRLANNWKVARMLSRMPFPYTQDMAADWIARQAAQRAAGAEYCYAIEFEKGFVGTCGLQLHADGTREIGYWIGEPYWNRGFATEAASALTERAKARFGGESIVSGHYADNHASGRVLTKLGFRYTGEESRWCEARQEKAHCLTMKLMRVEA